MVPDSPARSFPPSGCGRNGGVHSAGTRFRREMPLSGHLLRSGCSVASRTLRVPAPSDGDGGRADRVPQPSAPRSDGSPGAQLDNSRREAGMRTGQFSFRQLTGGGDRFLGQSSPCDCASGRTERKRHGPRSSPAKCRRSASVRRNPAGHSGKRLFDSSALDGLVPCTYGLCHASAFGNFPASGGPEGRAERDRLLRPSFSSGSSGMEALGSGFCIFSELADLPVALDPPRQLCGRGKDRSGGTAALECRIAADQGGEEHDPSCAGGGMDRSSLRRSGSESGGAEAPERSFRDFETLPLEELGDVSFYLLENILAEW